jgi:hypothetical protein
MAAAEYEKPGVRRDTPLQPFRKLDMAEKCAGILERMTGDSCAVIARGVAWYQIERMTAEGKVVVG